MLQNKQTNNEDLVEFLNAYTKKSKNVPSEKAQTIDFFDAKVKRLKKKLSPSQYEKLKDEYEDLREENLNDKDEDWKPTTFKEHLLKLLEKLGLIEVYFEDEEYDVEEENNKK